MGAPGHTKQLDFPPVSTTLKFDPEAAALKRAEVILPLSLAPNLAGAQRACPRPLADASNCPESSRVGTAIIDSPLQAQPVRGPVYIAFNLDNPIGSPRADGDPAAAGGRAAGRPRGVGDVRDEEHLCLESRPPGEELHARVRRRAPRRGADAEPGPLRTRHRQDDGGPPRRAQRQGGELLAGAGDARLRPIGQVHDAAEAEAGRPWWHASAPREGSPGLEQFTLRLPKTLSRGKVRPLVLSGGRRMRPLSRRRLASMPFPGEARTATLVWRGLRAGRRLRRTAVVRLTMTDAKGKTTSVKRRVRVRGKAPKARLGHHREPPAPAASEVLRLRVAVRTEHHEVLDAVVQAVAVRVM